MSDYQLLEDDYVLRLKDEAVIPPDVRNVDYLEYSEWLAEGNSPLPIEAATDFPPDDLNGSS